MAPTKDNVVDMASFGRSFEDSNKPSAVPKDSKNVPVPPPATRHRGVLKIVHPVPLYDFGNQMEEPTLLSVINESRDAQPLFKVSSVCTDYQQVLASEDQMVNITIRFYSDDFQAEGNGGRAERQMKEIKAIMPKAWTPRMYLGAVNVSIERNRSIIIETIYIHGNRYVSINDIHWLFTEQNLDDPSMVASKLVSNAAYFNVKGGELNSF